MSGRPSVTLKLATSLDGRIALADGTSQWITGSASRKRVHQLRGKHDAILAGIGTVLADDPLLTARLDGYRGAQPLRVVADTEMRTPPDSQIIKSITAENPVCLVTGHDVGDDATARARGIKLAECGATISHRTKPEFRDGERASPLGIVTGIVETLENLLGRKPQAERFKIFLEGGGKLAASFLRAGLVDRIEWFRAPVFIGGDGIPAFGKLGLTALSDAPKWRTVATERIGEDDLTTYVQAE